MLLSSNYQIFFRIAALPIHWGFTVLLTCTKVFGWTAAAGAVEPQASFVTAILSGKDNALQVHTANGTVILDVQSPRGIGRATVALNSTPCPEQIVLRLHIQGLEGFHLRCGERTISVAVASGSDQGLSQNVSLAGEHEQAITPDNPYWLTIERIAMQTAPPFPLDRGYFEISVPRDCLCAGVQSFSLQWIDFYR